MPRIWIAMIALAIVLSVWGAALLRGGETDASHGVSAPGTVDIVAIDAEISGNFPTFVADIDGCHDGLSPGQFVTIDVVVDEVDPTDGIGAAGFDLVYNPTLLRIESRAGESAIMFAQASPQGTYVDFLSDALPDSDGDYRHDAIEVAGTAESGEGVVGRFIVQVVAAGVATIDLTDQTFFADGEPDIYDPLGNVLDVIQPAGDIELRSDGSVCPTPTPSPVVTPPPTPTLPPSGTPSAPPAVCPAPTTTPTPTALPPFGTPGPSTAYPLFCNANEQAASDLHFRIPNIAPAVTFHENAPGCPEPSITVSTEPTHTAVDVVWPGPCVDPGEYVIFSITCQFSCNPSCHTWTLFGSALPVSSTPCPTPTPTPPLTPTPGPGSATPCPTISPTNCDIAPTPPVTPTPPMVGTGTPTPSALPTPSPTPTPLPSATPEPVRCNGQVPTRFGTARRDIIFASPGDVVDALGGNDLVIVRGGGQARATICGGAGNDVLIGGNGDDVLLGGPGRDILIGKKGDDSMDGGAGTDICVGSSGNNHFVDCEKGARKP